MTSVPPINLRLKVHGNADISSFHAVGLRIVDDIQAALSSAGFDLTKFQNILDFGCGCGRSIVAVASRAPKAQLYGTDFDAEAVQWCKTEIRGIEFDVNSALPPLKYPGNFFDLIVVVSVFTHLQEDYQFAWLEELRRVVKPGGIVLATLHGRSSWEGLPVPMKAVVETKGFLFNRDDHWGRCFPDWYHTSFHSKSYVEAHWNKYFKLLLYGEKSLNNHQDIAVLQKPS